MVIRQQRSRAAAAAGSAVLLVGAVCVLLAVDSQRAGKSSGSFLLQYILPWQSQASASNQLFSSSLPQFFTSPVPQIVSSPSPQFFTSPAATLAPAGSAVSGYQLVYPSGASLANDAPYYSVAPVDQGPQGMQVVDNSPFGFASGMASQTGVPGAQLGVVEGGSVAPQVLGSAPSGYAGLAQVATPDVVHLGGAGGGVSLQKPGMQLSFTPAFASDHIAASSPLIKALQRHLTVTSTQPAVVGQPSPVVRIGTGASQPARTVQVHIGSSNKAQLGQASQAQKKIKELTEKLHRLRLIYEGHFKILYHKLLSLDGEINNAINKQPAVANLERPLPKSLLAAQAAIKETEALLSARSALHTYQFHSSGSSQDLSDSRAGRGQGEQDGEDNSYVQRHRTRREHREHGDGVDQRRERNERGQEHDEREGGERSSSHDQESNGEDWDLRRSARRREDSEADDGRPSRIGASHHRGRRDGRDRERQLRQSRQEDRAYRRETRSREERRIDRSKSNDGNSRNGDRRIRTARLHYEHSRKTAEDASFASNEYFAHKDAMQHEAERENHKHGFIPPERTSKKEEPEFDESREYYDDPMKNNKNGFWGDWRKNPLGLPDAPGVKWKQVSTEQSLASSPYGKAMTYQEQSLSERERSKINGAWMHPEKLLGGYNLAGGNLPGYDLAGARRQYLKDRVQAASDREARSHGPDEVGNTAGERKWYDHTLRHYENHQNKLPTFV